MMLVVRLLLSTLLVAVCSNLCLGIVTEPVDDISAIRLSPPKKPKTGRAGQQANPRTMQAAPKQKPVPTKHDGTTETLKTESKASHPKVMLNITEPPQGSIILGSTFAVKIDILAPDRDSFLSHFNTTESKVCASLNAGPFYCWPALAGKIFYTEVEENEYTLEAMLYRAGKLDHSTKTISKFKTVHDAKLADNSTDEEVSNDAADQSLEAPAQVQVDYPRVGVSSPNNLVTYPGHSVFLHFDLEPNDVDSFQHYFANAFVCVNIDQAPAFSCFTIFGDENYAAPLVLNLPNGKHTLEAALSHPETGEVLESSKSTTSTFFTAGELLEAAHIAVDVTVADERHVVPLIEGTNLDAQTNAFCDSVGMAESKTCKERVKHKLWSAWEDMLQSL